MKSKKRQKKEEEITENKISKEKEGEGRTREEVK